MTSLFISYSRRDSEFAHKLIDAFKGQDWEFWIDWEAIPPTVDWKQQIERGIEESGVFLFLISPDSVKSEYCRQEIEHAAENGKRLIPLVVRDVNAQEVPSELGKLNWIFIRENDDFQSACEKLFLAVSTDYDWVRTHRQLQFKALEWKKNNSSLLRGTELQLAEFQLATNALKDPHPTDLQKDYVLKSRQAADRQRKTFLGTAIAIGVVLAALAVFGWVQAARATAQTKIALARQLAAQAQSMHTTGNSKRELAVLLSVLSMQIYPVIDSAQILQTNVLAYPVAKMTHNGYVSSVAFSPNGKFVVSGSEDGTARVWEALTGKEIARISHDSGVSSLAFSPNGKFVVSGSEDGTARVWEALTGKEIAHISHDSAVNSVAFSPDGKQVVSASYDGSIRVWEALTGKEIARMTPDNGVNLIALSSDGKHVVSASYDGIVRVWEALTGKELTNMKHGGEINSVAFSPDGKFVVSASDSIRVWEALTGKEIARMTIDWYVWSVAFSPDGKFVVSASEDGTARVWEVATGKETARMPHDRYVWSVAFSPDGKFVVSASYDGTARVWEALTGKEIARMTPNGHIRSVGFSPDGNYVVTGSDDSAARVWEITTGKETARITNNSDVKPLIFSRDGRYKVTVTNDGIARVQEVATDKEIAHMKHDFGVRSVAISPDGKYVVAGGCDRQEGEYRCIKGTARVWEALSGKEIARMDYDSDVNSVAFSPDGKYVIFESDDGAARMGIYRPEDLIADACSRVTRNLARDEWEFYIGDILPYQAVCQNLPIEPNVILTPTSIP